TIVHCVTSKAAYFVPGSLEFGSVFIASINATVEHGLYSVDFCYRNAIPNSWTFRPIGCFELSECLTACTISLINGFAAGRHCLSEGNSRSASGSAHDHFDDRHSDHHFPGDFRGVWRVRQRDRQDSAIGAGEGGDHRG